MSWCDNGASTTKGLLLDNTHTGLTGVKGLVVRNNYYILVDCRTFSWRSALCGYWHGIIAPRLFLCKSNQFLCLYPAMLIFYKSGQCLAFCFVEKKCKKCQSCHLLLLFNLSTIINSACIVYFGCKE